MKRLPAARRGFTLLEMMLAATVGALIVATAAGVFGAIGRSQKRTGEVATLALESARLREVIQASLREIVVTNKSKPARRSTAVAQPSSAASATEAGGGEGAGGTGGGGGGGTGGGDPLAAGKANAKPGAPANALPAGKEAAAKALADAKAQQAAKGGKGKSARVEEDDTQPPRLLLENGSGEAVGGGRQRLEVVVAGSPWAVKLRDGGSIMPMPEAGGGVRGAFELREDPEARGTLVGGAGGAGGVGGATLAMYWRVFAFGDGPSDERQPLGEARLCGGIRSFEWKLYKTSEETDQLEARTELVARTAAKMPAYAEARVRFADGSVVNWMFEVGYVLGRDQDTLPTVPADLAARLAESRKAGADGSGTPVAAANGGAGPVGAPPVRPAGGGGGGGGGPPNNPTRTPGSIFNRPPPPRPGSGGGR